MSIREYRKKVKFVTGGADGVVKVWSGMGLVRDIQFVVSKYSVTAICFMTLSKKPLKIFAHSTPMTFHPWLTKSENFTTKTNSVKIILTTPTNLDITNQLIETYMTTVRLTFLSQNLQTLCSKLNTFSNHKIPSISHHLLGPLPL